jgi:hypothetical protein
MYLKKVRCGLDSTSSGQVGSCAQGKEHSGSIKVGEFLDYLNDRQFPKKKIAQWT